MSSDLEGLIRDTLQARAATVTAVATDADAATREAMAPGDHGPRRRIGWLAAAAAVVGIVALSAAAVELGGHDSGVQSGTGHNGSCVTKLPAAWRAAFSTAPTHVRGALAHPDAYTAAGTVLEWFTADRIQHVGLRSPAGMVRTLYDVPAHQTGIAAVDGRWVVVSTAPDTPNGRVDNIVVLDTRSTRVRHILGRAPVPADYVVADKSAAVLAGDVYWTAVPPSPVEKGLTRRGDVLRYDIATGRTRTVGHSVGLTATDPRGVTWYGGSVAAAGVPGAVPPVDTTGSSYTPVVSDGPDWAWTDLSGDQQTIGWADRSGDVRRWHVNPTGRSDIRSDPFAVSGPFVFLAPGGYGDPHVYVLDTRSGAVADSGIQAAGTETASPTRVAIGTRRNDHADFSAVEFDTKGLPGLQC